MKLPAGTCVLLAIFAAAPSWVCSQAATAPPLVISGKVLSIDVESNESWRLKCQANVELHYRNAGDRPIIFIRRSPVLMQEADVHWNDDGTALFSSSQLFDEVVYSTIDAPIPSASETVTVPPKGEYLVQTRVALNLIRSETNNKHLTSKSLRASLELTLTPWPRLFATSKSPDVEYLDPDELYALLKARWVATGDLAPVEVAAEPIQFDLPLPARTFEKSGLVLRGKVTGWTSPPEKSVYVEFQANLELEIKNTGPEPVLVLKPECTGYGDYLLGSVQLLSAPDTKGAGNLLNDWTAWPSLDRSQKWQAMRDEMDQATSPEEHFWLIQPGESRVFPSWALMQFDDIRTIGRSSPQEIWPEIKKQKQLWLAVQIDIWPNNLETVSGGADNPEFGRKLRDRWSSAGVLELGKDGLIESEPFPIELPSAP